MCISLCKLLRCCVVYSAWSYSLLLFQTGPILQCNANTKRLTAGHWSNSRPGVFYIAKQDGTLDVWDLLDRTHEPSMSQSITPAPITNIYPWQVTSEYHHPCLRASTQHPSPISTPGRSPVSITIHVWEHHPHTHHQHLALAGHQWVSPSMSQSITPAPITNIYPWQVTSKYHHPCPRASPQHPSPTSTPGRSPVSITIHVWEHHPSTHHQHLPLAGHQWVSPSMSESITPASITNIYPWQVTSEYHHPCPRASPPHPSPTSTPGRSTVSITIHVLEHHPHTHQQHLPLVGYQWVSPSMSQSITHAPISLPLADH